jgi:alpha-L-rhamnosidase
MRAANLKTEFMRDPIGLSIRRPRLSWTCVEGKKQTAYEIIAFCGGELFWESGRVETDEMFAFPEKDAQSRQRITWQVRLWDENDQPGDWSERTAYEMGLLEQSDYQARWIDPELERDPEAHKPASYLKKRFSVTAEEAAGTLRLYATAHGLYEVRLNGRRAGDFVLAPGCSSYDKVLNVQTNDVSGLLREGENELIALLGDGWYRSCSGVDGDRNIYGEDVALWLQLESDGRPILCTDSSWEASQSGPLRENDMQQGEVYDARREEIADWHGVKVCDYGTANFACSNSVPIREHEHFEGKLLTTPNGETVLDFGQNLAGFVSFTLSAHAGQTVTLSCGETLDENGNFTQENFQDRKRHKEGGTRQQVVYTCREGENRYKTRFAIFGFRYAKVETEIDLTGAAFEAIAVYSDMAQLSTFESGNADVNRLFENCVWSQKGNFCDVPTDCPTRERAAWTGDMGVFAPTGLSLLDCYPVVRRWLGECRLNQFEDGRVANIAPRNNRPSFFSGLLAGSVGWGDACILVPWALYERYGDTRILEENYDMMCRWLAYLSTRAGKKQEVAPAGMDPAQLQALMAKLGPEKLKEMAAKMGLSAQNDADELDAYTISSGIDYGEWCEPDVIATDAMRTPQPKVATAYYALSSLLLSRIAALLEREADSEHFLQQGMKAREAFRRLALTEEKIISERQAEYVRAISFGLLDEDELQPAADDLAVLVKACGDHLNTGFLSTPDLCPVLAENGHVETAYDVLLQDTQPSWLYAVKKGATTIWEVWNGIDENGVPHESLNHYSKGAIAQWLLSGVCGINLQEGALTLKPLPDRRLGHARAAYDSSFGRIVSGWTYEGEKINYHFEIPANLTASVTLPDGREMELAAGVYDI